MALFIQEKKKIKKVPGCTCNCDYPEDRTEKIATECSPDRNEHKTCDIKVLGAGCKSCRAQYENAKQAVKDMGLSAKLEYITDMHKVIEYGVMRMPALVINKKVVAMGKVLKSSDIIALLKKLGF